MFPARLRVGGYRLVARLALFKELSHGQRRLLSNQFVGADIKPLSAKKMAKYRKMDRMAPTDVVVYFGYAPRTMRIAGFLGGVAMGFFIFLAVRETIQQLRGTALPQQTSPGLFNPGSFDMPPDYKFYIENKNQIYSLWALAVLVTLPIRRVTGLHYTRRIYYRRSVEKFCVVSLLGNSKPDCMRFYFTRIFGTGYRFILCFIASQTLGGAWWRACD